MCAKRDELFKIAGKFALPGRPEEIRELKSGIINDTFLASYSLPDGSLKKYIVQRINPSVFPDPSGIMKNITRVTGWIKEKNLISGLDPERYGMNFLVAEDTGLNFYKDGEKNIWRVCDFICDSTGFEETDDPYVMCEAGRAVGRFQKLLCDFDAESLSETIPDFHNTEKRFADFERHLAEDKFARAASVREEADYLISAKEKACMLCGMKTAGEIPVRVTHNDTKLSNVLFDKESGKALTLIDLDTVMPGLAAYDFGDALRTGANTAAEDEKDLSKVSFDLKKASAFAEGFVKEAGSILTADEAKTLKWGIFSITVEQAVRFLDDFISGDVYYKTDHPGHNLERVRCQIALAKDAEKKLGELGKIIDEEYGKRK